MTSSLVISDSVTDSAAKNQTLLYIGWGAMVVGMFMAILDIQIVASSLNEIQAGLSASPDDIGWVQTSYLIAEVIMIPFSAFFSKLLSTKRAFIISALGFTIMSLVCSFAWSLESMLVFRALQGFVGGAMIPGAFATAFIIFPPEKRALANIIMGMVVTMAPTVGPSLGGWITDTFSWNWLFLINVVPGILVVIAVALMPNIDKPDRSMLKGFDGWGFALMATFLGSLEFVLDEGPKEDWFDNHHILLFTVICALSAVGFFWRVLTYCKPIVDLRAFCNRNFAVGSLFSFVVGVGLFGIVYTMPLFLGRVGGLNSLQIGSIMIITGVFQFCSAPIAGRLSESVDPRRLLMFGLFMFSLGLYLHSMQTAESRYWEFFASQAIWGIGTMFILIPINDVALGTLPPEEIKNASGLFNLMRNLGGAIGLALINTLLDERTDFHRDWISNHVNDARPEFAAYSQAIESYLGTPPPDTVMLRMADGLVMRESMVLAFNDVHLILAGILAFAMVLVPLVKKPSNEVSGGH